PSPLTSAAVTERGPFPTVNETAARKPPLPSFSNRDSVPPALLFALIKSSLPPLLTSAAMTAEGVLPTLFVDDATKPPLPLFVRIVSEPLLEFAAIKSSLPSPFTSAATTERVPLPTDGEEESE